MSPNLRNLNALARVRMDLLDDLLFDEVTQLADMRSATTPD